MPRKDLYKILGVEKTASADQIKSAYRKLVLKHHPDRAGNSQESVDLFVEIQEAYEVLSDQSRRRSYDLGHRFEGSVLSGSKSKYPTKKELYRIRIRVRPRMTRVGDEVEVVVEIHQLLSDDFELLGLERFQVLEGPIITEHSYNDREGIFQRVHYTLTPLSTGYVAVGPMAVVYRGVRYVSGEVLINVNYADSKIRRSRGSGISTGQMVFASIFMMAFMILVGYNIYHYGTKPRNPRHKKTYPLPNLSDDRQLMTGVTPYSDIYGLGREDPLMHNQVQFINGNFYDVVVSLLEVETDKVVRHNYIRAKEKYTMKHIPNGEYYLKAYFGRDWDGFKETAVQYKVNLDDLNIKFEEDLPIKEGVITKKFKGGFNKYEKYEQFKHESQTLKMEQFLEGDSLDYSIYKITLYPVIDGNVPSESIDEQEFFR